MTIRDVVRWNTRVSAVYALGIWTMVGSYAYFRYTGQYEDEPVKKEAVEEPEDQNKQIYQTTHSKTVIIYKKDFVPYTTRIYNLFQSFSGGSGPGDGNK